MTSVGRELLVMEMMGVWWSNFLIIEVAETPSSLGMTISWDYHEPKKPETRERHCTEN
jgi:hypothetical protein